MVRFFHAIDSLSVGKIPNAINQFHWDHIGRCFQYTHAFLRACSTRTHTNWEVLSRQHKRKFLPARSVSLSHKQNTVSCISRSFHWHEKNYEVKCQNGRSSGWHQVDITDTRWYLIARGARFIQCCQKLNQRFPHNFGNVKKFFPSFTTKRSDQLKPIRGGG
jgi:hypothetical protein